MNTRSSGRLVPKLWDCLGAYDRRTLTADAIAGMTVGLVALTVGVGLAFTEVPA